MPRTRLFPIPLLSSHLPGSKPSFCTAEKAVGGAESGPLWTAPTPSPRCRCPPRWSVAYDVSSDQECRSLPGGTIYSTTTARAIRPTTWTSPQTRSTVSATPSRLTPRRREPKTGPRHSLRAMLAFLAALVAFPRTVALQQCTAVTARLLGLPYSLATTFTTSCACMRSTYGSRSSSLAPRLSPPRATMSNASLSSAQTQLLSGTGSTTRSIAGERSKCNEHSRRPCRLHRLPAPGAGFLCAHAGLRYKPWLLRNANTTGTILRDAQHMLQLSPTLPASHVHPQCHTAPLVDDSAAPPPMRSTPRASFPSPAPATSAAMTLPRAGSARTTRRQCVPRAPPVPAFHARGLRQARTGHRDKSRCDEPGRGTERTLPRDFRSHRGLCSSNLRRALASVEGYCVNAAEVPIRTRIT
ncbi:hypothetical protein B0H14DRAFT_3677656 [Mycena olivaceomarginata]|nr:hypothetical protein B0H14DRAFT_3677656 [Mycena olivaceomarginata]